MKTQLKQLEPLTTTIPNAHQKSAITYAQGHSLPSPTSLPPPPETWHFEWSDQYNDYLVYYYDSAGDEDSEIHHSVWKWLVSAMEKVEEDMDLETEGGSSTQPEAVAED